MLKTVAETICHISGRRGKPCYYVLSKAIMVTVSLLPEEPPMKVICGETAKLCGKGSAAVWKALSRAVDDLWEFGNREELKRILGHAPTEKPSPRDFILLLSFRLWCGRE